MGDISRNFSAKEFACPCCGFSNIDLLLISKLQIIRDRLGKPLKINSGCRCQKHNLEVGGEPNSPHLRGYAADIHISDSTYRYKLIKLAIAEEFTRIGIYPTWVHLDIGDYRDLTSYPPVICWVKLGGNNANG